MRKLFLSIAALLPGLLAYSQGADSLGRYAEVSVIPRLDLNPTYTSGESGIGFNHGNSSLYTLFEGSLSEHFSWTLANHWFQFGGDYAWPYRDLGRSDTTNWLDYCLLDFSFGSGWTVSAGKGMIATGGFEFDDWDWDVHSDLASPLWDGLVCYQWGISLAWELPSELSTFILQMTASPYGEYPLTSNLRTYSFQWWGDFDWLSTVASVSAMEYEQGRFDWLWCAGLRFDLSDAWAMWFEWNNSCGFDEDTWRLSRGNTVQANLSYAPSERFDLGLRGWYALTGNNSLLDDSWAAGAIFQYYPLRESDALRLHAYVAYNSILETATLSIGARYNLTFNIF